MDNLTHSLVGLALAETGLKRLTPLATTTLIVAANFPDIDIVTGLAGPLVYLEHHRGITHALMAIPPLSILLAILIYVCSLRAKRKPRFAPLAGLSFLGMLTHPLLDYLNSYGWRPWLPWNNQWQYGDTAFVIDPWIWAVVGGVMFLLSSHTRSLQILWAAIFLATAAVVIVAGEVALWIRMLWMIIVCGVIALRFFCHCNETQARRLSTGVLAALLIYLAALVALHHFALKKAQPLIATVQAREGNEGVTLSALPVAARPLVWRVVVSTDRAFYLTDVNLLKAVPALDFAARHLRKQGDIQAITTAHQTAQAQTFLRFARFPVSRVSAFDESGAPAEVEIRDVRFQPVSSQFITRIRLQKNLRPNVE
jgi:inner membrane protein